MIFLLNLTGEQHSEEKRQLLKESNQREMELSEQLRLVNQKKIELEFEKEKLNIERETAKLKLETEQERLKLWKVIIESSKDVLIVALKSASVASASYYLATNPAMFTKFSDFITNMQFFWK